MGRLMNELTERIYTAFGIDAPIDIRVAVQAIGGFVQEVDVEWPRVRLQKIGDRSFAIEVSQGVEPVYGTLLIANQLGHLFLHMGYCIDPKLWNSYAAGEYYEQVSYEKEYQADMFARALLMPEKLFLRRVELLEKDGMVAMSKVADYFQVRLDAAKLRGRELGVI